MTVLFTVAEVAKTLRIQYRAVLALIHEGRITASNVGRGARATFRITEDSLDAFLRQNAVASPIPAASPPPMKKRRASKDVGKEYFD